MLFLLIAVAVFTGGAKTERIFQKLRVVSRTYRTGGANTPLQIANGVIVGNLDTHRVHIVSPKMPL